MIRIYFSILFIAGIGCIEAGNQNPQIKTIGVKTETNDSLILWSSKRKLTWSDFQGIPDPTSKYTALTYVTVEVKPIKLTNNEAEYEMTCWFEKKLSWSKSKKSVNLLRHEQLHFDITELATRNMRKKFLFSKPSDLKKAKEMVRKILQEEEEERAFINNKYDLETEHGTIASKQKEWEEKITKELKSLEAYSSSKVTIRFGR